MGPREDPEAWFNPQVETWVDGVWYLDKVTVQNPHTDYYRLGTLLQLEWKYLQINSP